MNWEKITSVMSNELNLFVNKELSAKNLYKEAVKKGIGAEVRPLDRSCPTRGRKNAREALRRRKLLSI